MSDRRTCPEGSRRWRALLRVALLLLLAAGCDSPRPAPSVPATPTGPVRAETPAAPDLDSVWPLASTAEVTVTVPAGWVVRRVAAQELATTFGGAVALPPEPAAAAGAIIGHRAPLQRDSPRFTLFAAPRSGLSLSRYLEEVAEALQAEELVELGGMALDSDLRLDGLPTAVLTYTLAAVEPGAPDLLGRQVATLDEHGETIWVLTFLAGANEPTETADEFRRIAESIRSIVDR